jgi:hypothetical protein
MDEHARPQGFRVWQLAMEALRAAERQLEAARTRSAGTLLPAMHREVEALRTRADLILADAVKAMRRD